MKIMMPLLPDMQEKKMRTIEASIPDDTTQEEFWNFVLMASVNLFGVKTREGVNEEVSRWNPVGSFMAFVESKGLTNDSNRGSEDP